MKQELQKTKSEARAQAWKELFRLNHTGFKDYTNEAHEMRFASMRMVEKRKEYDYIFSRLYEKVKAQTWIDLYVKRLTAAVKIHKKDPLTIEGYKSLIESVNERLESIMNYKECQEQYEQIRLCKLQFIEQLRIAKNEGNGRNSK